MSTAVDSSNENTQELSQNAHSIENLVEDLDKSTIQPDAQDTQAVAQPEVSASRSRIIYTRKQLVGLSQSPLVKPPDGMPEFKIWFGELNEQALLSARKDADSITSNGSMRERRYRREQEDGDGSTRPFRSGLSQPSQMGNFKHQPLRSNDRDRDMDLRSLSDRYDRDKATRGERMGMAPHSTLLRNRDRDSATHLAPDRDTQRNLTRKRNGESKEDWRRGAEPPRSGRDENNSRRDRDDRERQRSRARESSRAGDSPPSTRRDREDHRKDRDRDRFDEADEDRKRWRDDGKREDKLGTRREKDNATRDKDTGRDRSREHANDRDGWSIADDKRRGARDRRHDDIRDREEKREREKEKEPAWMETYVPPVTSSSGILGGKGGDGEIDSIQAWKKDMKERERKAKGLVSDVTAPPASSPERELNDAKPSQTPLAAQDGAPMDEIQLFKKMMKESQRPPAGGDKDDSPSELSGFLGTSEKHADNGIPGPTGVHEIRTSASAGTDQIASGAISSSNGLSSSIDPLLAAKSTTSLKGPISIPSASSPTGAGTLPNPSHNSHLSGASNGPRLLSLKTPDTANFHEPVNKDAASSAPAFDPPRTSRLLAFGSQSAKVTVQPSPQSAAAAVQMGRLQQMDPIWPNQRRPSASPAIPHSASHQSAFDKATLQSQILAGGQLEINTTDLSRRTGLEQLGYNVVYENAPRSGNPLDGTREIINIDTARTSVPLSGSERTPFISQADSLQHLTDARRNPTPPTAGYSVTSPISPFESQLGGAQNTYSSGKGSRMAKHFERQRDQAIVSAGRNLPNAGMGNNGLLSNRQEQTLNNPAGAGETRNIQDLLTMLTNSAQAQRGQLNQNLGQHQPSQSLHIGHVNGSLGRIDPMLDSDEGRFAPDGLVPGLRPAVPPAARNREMNAGGIYAAQLDDPVAFNPRLGPQQRSGIDQLLASQVPSQFNGHGLNGGRGGIGLQQQTLRGGPSPIGNFNPGQGLQQQRLPPGLANLGSRPPHEPSQFLGGGAAGFGNVPSQLHAGMQHSNNPQAIGQFQNPGFGMIGNQPNLRGQPGLGQLGQLGGGLNGMDFRGGPATPTQNQLLGLGGPNLGQTMRGGPGFPTQQMHGPNQLHPSMNVRQQHNLQPQVLQQMLPQQLQSIPPGQHNPNDLMALLMGNAHRE